MRNLCALKLSAVVTIGSLAALAAMPAKAQQVILTPGGTMVMPTMPGVPGDSNLPGGGIPVPELGLPQYDILTQDQLKPGKLIFRGKQIEIMAPDDPRINEAMRLSASPDTVWVYTDYMVPGVPMVNNVNRAQLLAPPPTTNAPSWDRIVRVGLKIPGNFGSADNVIIAGNDPRIPENLRGIDLGGVYYWAIDARATNLSLPVDLFTPRLYSLVGDDGNMGFGIEIAKVNPESVAAGIQQYQRDQAWRNPPPGDPSETVVVVPPGDRSYVTPLPTPIFDETLTNIDYALGTPGSVVPTLAANGSSVTTVVASDAMSSVVTPVVAPATASMPPATIAVSPIARPTATIQGSQNPTADFAAANGFDRSRMPAQLNRQLMESPLSSSRVFPGMR
jgi:hypothetical protein